MYISFLKSLRTSMPSLIKRVKAVLSGLHADLHFVGNRRALYCQQIIYNEKRKKSSLKDGYSGKRHIGKKAQREKGKRKKGTSNQKA